MKMNPEYKAWKAAQAGGVSPSAPLAPGQPDKALPIVTNMDDYMELNETQVASGGQEVPLSESTNATIEIMQEPEIAMEAGMSPDTMVDELGGVLNKYEVPMGLMNKLMMLSEYQSLEFMIDDSGSMNLETDSIDKRTNRYYTRWQEANVRLKEMIEILAYVPFTQVEIVFLNRPDRVVLVRNGKNPQTFLQEANAKIDQLFQRGPAGTTPVLNKFQDSLIRNQGRNVARYFFGDGTPDGGPMAQREIVKILKARQNPQGNPITFLSCTDDDDQVEWMKDAEELIPFCSESDDYADEAREVLKDQGAALPYSKGFHLICQLVAAMNPEDLDAMDESVPFTKATLDNLLGICHDETAYRHYFQCYLEAKQNRVVTNKADSLKKSVAWNYQEFLATNQASQIPAVQKFKEQLHLLEG